MEKTMEIHEIFIAIGAVFVVTAWLVIPPDDR